MFSGQRVIFWSLLIFLISSLNVETRFWLLIGWLSIGIAISFVWGLGMWAIFHFGAKGKLKVRVVLPDEKGEGNE